MLKEPARRAGVPIACRAKNPMPAGQIKLKTPPSAISKRCAAQASQIPPDGDTSRARKAEKLKDRYRARLKEPARRAGVPNFAGRRKIPRLPRRYNYR